MPDCRPTADPVPADGGGARPRAAARATAGSTSRSGTGSAACSRTSGGELALWSRNERPLLRYFPELRPLGELLPPSSALDGEIVIARDGALDFDAMQTRLHPAESRIRRLSAEIPAEYVAFDMLLWDGEPVWKLPLDERRARVEALTAGGFRVSPATRSVDEARGWLERFEALGLDGVVAKRLGVPYLPGSREGMAKVKEHKAADCVVVGDSLEGRPQCDRDAAARPVPRRRRARLRRLVRPSRRGHATEVAARVLPLLDEQSDRRFSEPNRWGTGELEEAALRPELVVEVRYDKVQGNRFRHGTKLLRWRDDKDPRDCTWRELRPPRDPNAPGVESLFAA